jgi:hypothetical protein
MRLFILYYLFDYFDTAFFYTDWLPPSGFGQNALFYSGLSILVAVPPFALSAGVRIRPNA